LVLIKAVEQVGGAIDKTIELRIPQNTVRKYHRLHEFSHILGTIQPLISFRDDQVKSERDGKNNLQTLPTRLDLLRSELGSSPLAKALEDAASV
jgi:hypothetical protein